MNMPSPFSKKKLAVSAFIAAAFSLTIPTHAAARQTDPNGVYTKTGNGVTAPTLLSKVEPTYTEVARKLLVDQARVRLSAIVETNGTASNFSVMIPIGYGLDESAIDAVRQWRFNPGMKDGKPVRIRSTFEVSFRLAHPPDQSTWYSGPMAFSIATTVAPPVVEDGSMPSPQAGSSNETAILEFTVDTKGSVKNVHPIHGSEAATQLLGQYLAGWKFRPAIDGANIVEATGRIRFTRGTGDETNNLALFSIPAAAPTVAAKPSENYPSLENLSPALLAGQYRREPMLNNWHQGVIATDTKSGDQKLRWWNDAGVSWALTPDMADGILITDYKENPYYDKDPEKGRTFRIRMLPGNAGVDGFEFLGEFYKRISPQIASAANTTPDIAVPAPNVPSNQAAACIAPPAGLIGWWPGDNDANDIIGGHNPTAVSALSVIPGKVNTGFQFGQQGYIEIPKSPTLENQRFTWLAWVRPDGPGPNTTSLIINQNIDGSDAAVSLGWRSDGQRFSFLSGHNPEDLITSNDTFPPGAFYLVTATYDGSTFKLYVNGKLEGSRFSTKPIPYSKYGWEIGAGELRFFPRFPDTWNGVIDELQAYNRALTESEIESIYQADSAGVCKPGAPPVSTATQAPSNSPKTQVNPKDGLSYVWIPPGKFRMGCSEGDTECAANEDSAQNGIILRGFWLGQTEVTQAAYKRVMGTNPSAHKGDQLPVEMVSWFDAVKYCQAIGGNLPNESQWEYAARAGTKYARYGNVDAVAWHAGNSGNQTHPVGTKQPNDFALYDMLGNVSEWTEDTFPGGEAKVERGGSAFANITDLRASARHSNPPADSAMSLGFRCAVDQPAPDQVTMDRGEQLHVPIDDPQAAQNAYIKAMQANRRSSLAHFRIGELFLSQNNLQSAANEFRSAMNGDLNPKWTEVWSHIDLGKIFDITGQRDRAANEYQQAIRAHDNTFGAQSVARDGYEHATQSTVSGGSPNAAPTTPASPPIPPSVLEEESNLPRLGSPELERTLQGPSAPSKPSAYDVPPKLLYKAEPKYSEEARKAKYSGTVLLSVEIDTKGRVGAIRVVRPLGLGLDEKAIECVQKWKFRPALKDGRPVAVRVSIEISFRLL